MTVQGIRDFLEHPDNILSRGKSGCKDPILDKEHALALAATLRLSGSARMVWPLERDIFEAALKNEQDRCA